MIDARAFLLLNRAVDLLERMDPERRGDRPAATDEECDVLHRDLHTFVYEEWCQRLSTHLCELYEPNEVRKFMHAPNKLLGGGTPCDLIAQGRAEEVSAVVQRRLDCVYL
jgi:hypothetical protein